MNYCFGVDVGGTTVKIGLFTTEGELLDKWEIPTITANGGEAILPDIVASLKAKMEEKAIEKDQVTGIGIGLPAMVGRGGIINRAVNLGWGRKNVKEEMESMIGIHTEVGNDANMAALGEMWLGAAKGEKDLILITIGTGLGGGIIIDGNLLTGSSGAAGEIGHMRVNEEETEVCGCGNKGCLEQYVSATGITRLATRRLAEDDKPSMLREVERVNAKAVFDALKAGDEVAKEVTDRFSKILGRGLANLAAVTDPTMIVVGGGVSKAGNILVECIEKGYKDIALVENRDAKIVLATLGNDAGICGAAKMVL